MAFESIKSIIGAMARQKLTRQTPQYRAQQLALEEMLARQKRQAQVQSWARTRGLTEEQLDIAGAYAEGGQFAAALKKRKWEQAKIDAKQMNIDPGQAMAFQDEIDKSITETALAAHTAPARRELAAGDIQAKAAAEEAVASEYADERIDRATASQQAKQETRKPYDEFLAGLRARYTPKLGSTSATVLTNQWVSMVKSGGFVDRKTKAPVTDAQFQTIQEHYFDSGGKVLAGYKYDKSYRPYKPYGGTTLDAIQYKTTKDELLSAIDDRFDEVPKRYQQVWAGINNLEESTLKHLVDQYLAGDPLINVPVDMKKRIELLAAYEQATRQIGEESRTSGGTIPRMPKRVTPPRLDDPGAEIITIDPETKRTRINFQ